MATNFVSPDMTNGAAVKCVHAGLNSRVVNWTDSATRSGGAVIQICELPVGARVQGGFIRWSANPGETAGAVVRVYDSLGNTYLSSEAYAVTTQLEGPDIGTRITGSANLLVSVTNVGNAPAATTSVALKVSVQYLAEDDGD